MENIEKLYNKGNFEEIIKRTKDAKDIDSLNYRILAYVGLHKLDDAQRVLNDNKDILKKDLPALMWTDINLSYLKENFDEAYSKLADYENEPYFSQEMEEMLAHFKKDIRIKEKQHYLSTHQDESIDKYLKVRSDESLYTAAALLKKADDINKYLDDILNIIKSCHRQQIRSLYLMILAEHKYDKPVTFLSFDGMVEVIPSELEDLNNSSDMQYFLTKKQEEKDVTYSQFFDSELVTFKLVTYCSDFKADRETLYYALRYSTLKKMEHLNQNEDEYVEEFGLDKNTFRKILDILFNENL